MKVKSDIFWLNLRRIKKVSFFVLLLLLPTQFGYHFWPPQSLVFGVRVDFLSPTVYFVDILIFILFVTSVNFSKKVFFLGIVFFLISLFIPYVSTYRYLKLLEAIFLGWFVYKNYKELKDKCWIFLFISTLLICFLATTQFLKGSSFGGLLYFLGERSFSINTPGIALFNILGRDFLRPYATLPHPNALAGYLVVSLLSLYILNIKSFKVALLPVCLVLLLSFSKAIFLGLILGLLIYLFSKRFKPKNVYVLSFFVFLILSLFTPIVANVTFDNGLVVNKATKERLGLSIVSASMLSKNPILGVGLGNFILRESEFVERGSVLLQPVHNIFLLILSETGLVGGFLFVVLCVYLLSRIGKGLEGNFFVGAALSTFFLDHYWLTLPQNTLILAVFIGNIFARIKKSDEPR